METWGREGHAQNGRNIASRRDWHGGGCTIGIAEQRKLWLIRNGWIRYWTLCLTPSRCFTSFNYIVLKLLGRRAMLKTDDALLAPLTTDVIGKLCNTVTSNDA